MWTFVGNLGSLPYSWRVSNAQAGIEKSNGDCLPVSFNSHNISCLLKEGELNLQSDDPWVSPSPPPIVWPQTDHFIKILYTIVKQSSSQNTTDCHYLAHRLLAPVTDSSTGLVPLQLADRYLRILLILILVRSLTCHHHSLQLVKQCAWNLAQLGMNGVLWPSLRMWML